jgi:hypothetical protein
MLLQTNSYVVPKEKRSEHARLLRRFKQVLHRLGCDHFEVYEQVGTNWTSDQSSGRFVQIMRFKDRKQQMAVQAAERDDPVAQAVIAEFCELINFPYQQQQGLFAIGYYTSILSSGKLLESPAEHAPAPPPEPAPAVVGAVGEQMTMVVDREDLAEAIDEGTPHAEGEVHLSPFAEAPIVAPVEGAEQTAHPAGTNGDGHGGASAAAEIEQEEGPPRSVGDDLDELIRQRFGQMQFGDNGNHVGGITPDAAEPGEATVEGEVHIGEVRTGEVQIGEVSIGEVHAGEVLEPDGSLAGGPAPAPEVVDEPLPGSGIGAVLDASLHGEDPDLDIPLPAELLEPPDSSGPHTPERSHARNEEHGHG